MSTSLNALVNGSKTANAIYSIGYTPRQTVYFSMDFFLWLMACIIIIITNWLEWHYVYIAKTLQWHFKLPSW